MLNRGISLKSIAVIIALISLIIYSYFQIYTNPSPSNREVYLPVKLDAYILYKQHDLARGNNVIINCVYPKEKEIEYPTLKVLAIPLKATIENVETESSILLKLSQAEGAVLNVFLSILQNERPKDCYVTIKKGD